MMGYYNTAGSTASNITWTTSTASTTDDWMFITPQAGGGYTVLSAPQAIRRPPPFEFNKYINGSDLLEEFIAFLGENKVKQGEVLKLPIDLFVKWLIIRACEQDQEEPNVTLELPAPHRHTQRCHGCGRFMRLSAGIPLHDVVCATRYYARVS